MKPIKALALTLALVAPMMAHAQTTLVMEGMAIEQIVKVFDSPRGYVQGFLTEDEAAQLQLITRSNFPIQVRTTIVHQYKQVGCARLQIDLQQSGVPTRTLQPTTVTFPPIQLNMCADGEPPILTQEVREVTAEAERKMQEELQNAKN